MMAKKPRARKPRVSKTEKVKQLLEAHPNWPVKKIAQQVGIHNTAVYKARRQMQVGNDAAVALTVNRPLNRTGEDKATLMRKDLETLQAMDLNRVRALLAMINTY